MYAPYCLVTMAKLHQEEIRRQVAQAQLVRQARLGTRSGTVTHRLGGLLITLGQKLQAGAPREPVARPRGGALVRAA